jgi:hypothetical protein
MADIMITIPRSVDWEEWLAEVEYATENGLDLYWRVAKAPKNCEVGDLCFIVSRMRVRGFLMVTGFVSLTEPFTCEFTGKVWPPGEYILRQGPFVPMPDLRWQQKGFQGFRYVREFPIYPKGLEL